MDKQRYTIITVKENLSMDENKKTSRQLSFDAFRENVRRLTESKGMLYKEVAEEIGATPATISRYLTELRDPELEYVYRLAKFFGVSIDWILGVADDRTSTFKPEVKQIADLYSKASDEDKEVVKTVLRKYI